MTKARDGNLKHFFSKVVGTSFPNNDGSSRLDEIRQCETLEPLLLVPEPNNPADPRAVAVYREKSKRQIGYMTKRAHGEVFDNIQKGYRYKCYIADLTGSYELPGVNIIVIGAGPAVTKEMLEIYADRVTTGLPIGRGYNESPALEYAPKKRKKSRIVLACLFVFMTMLFVKWLIPNKESEKQTADPSEAPTTRSVMRQATPTRSITRQAPRVGQTRPRSVADTLYEGLTYAEVAKIMGSQGAPAGTVGNQTKYRFINRDGKTLEAVFEDDSLISWETK